ncbi:hypothetical protein N9A45_01690 [bacterium]|nr:hypothetical protein [bacterium]
MQKQDWIRHIETTLSVENRPFTVSYTDPDKAPLIFACDVFRRRRHLVNMHFEPTLIGLLNLHVVISPLQSTLEITIKREDTLPSVIESLSDPHLQNVTIRGCGTVLNIVCSAMQYAIHNGWFVEKTFMNTLVQMSPDNIKQRNTTLSVYLCRGSQLDSI